MSQVVPQMPGLAVRGSNSNEIGIANLILNNESGPLKVFCFMPHSKHEQRYRGRNGLGVAAI